MQRGRGTLPQRLFDRHYAKKLVKDAALSVEKMLKKDYVAISRYASWTSDIWTGLGNKEMAGLTAHFIPADWSSGIQRVTLDLFNFPESHTGANIAEKFAERSRDWGAKPFQLTTDSGANVLLGTRLFLEKDGLSRCSSALLP
jgi:hypothetical protein